MSDDLIRELVEALVAQHIAIDFLMARCVHYDPAFRPSQSPAWPLMEQGRRAILKAEGCERIGWIPTVPDDPAALTNLEIKPATKAP